MPRHAPFDTRSLVGRRCKQSLTQLLIHGRSSLEVRNAVIADVRRAAELIETGLSSLGLRTPK